MNNRFHETVLAFAIILLFAVMPVSAAEKIPPQAVTKEMRCPVCGMYPARFPKWMVQVVFNDRSTLAFDSPLEIFRFLKNMAKYDARRSEKDIAVIYFTDYAKGGWVESKGAFFVSGSNAKGPMNNEDYPAFGSKEAAEAFARNNGGNMLAFDKVMSETLKELGGDHHHHDHHGH